MGVGERRSTTALFAVVGALSLDHMHAFAARMGSSALLPAFVKSAPSSLRRQPRQVRRTARATAATGDTGGLTYTIAFPGLARQDHSSWACKI